MLTGGVPVKTLRAWWEKRDKIMDQPAVVAERAMEMVKFRDAKSLYSISALIQDKINSIDVSKISLRELVDAYDRVFKVHLIMNGRSTSNVAHVHKHEGSVNLVEPE